MARIGKPEGHSCLMALNNQHCNGEILNGMGARSDTNSHSSLVCASGRAQLIVCSEMEEGPPISDSCKPCVPLSTT